MIWGERGHLARAPWGEGAVLEVRQQGAPNPFSILRPHSCNCPEPE